MPVVVTTACIGPADSDRAPEVIAVRHGTFAAWMMQRGQLGIQDNVPLKVTDQAVFEESRIVAAEWLTGSSH